MNEEEATTAADVVMVDGSDDDTDSVPTQASVPAVDEQTQKTNEEKENNEEKKDEQQPANTLRANIGLLNDYLICPLCKGYFRDAHTIPECLHTFCKVCIYKFFIDKDMIINHHCPVCNVLLEKNPLEFLKQDHAKQLVVDQMFPHFAEEEKKAREEFYRERSGQQSQGSVQQQSLKRKRDDDDDGDEDMEERDPASIVASLSSSSNLAPYHKAPTVSKILHGYYDDAVTFRIIATTTDIINKLKGNAGNNEKDNNDNENNEKEEKEDYNENEELLPQVKQFYVRTTGRVTVRQLQKLVFAELIEQQMEEMEVENDESNGDKEIKEGEKEKDEGIKEKDKKDEGTKEEIKKDEGIKEDKLKKDYVVRTPEDIVIRMNGKGKPLCQDNTLNFFYDSYKIDPHTQVPTFTYTKLDKKKIKKGN